MKRNRQRCIGAVLALLLLLAPVQAAWAEESLEDKLESLQNQAAEQQQKTDKVQSRIDTISEQLRQLQAEADEATASYQAVRDQLDSTETKIDDNQALLEKTEQELAVKSKLLEHRVRDIYIHGQLSYIDVLFGAQDFSDFMTRMDLLKRIIKYDYDLVSKVQQDRQTVIMARAALEKDKAAQVLLVADAKSKRDEMLDKKRAKDRLMDKMKYDRDTSERAYQELIAASKQVENLIRMSRYQYAGSPSGSGAMIWPISGEITSPFGWRVHPITGDSRFHSGIDIAGDYGDPIRAAASGTVIYAGWISGYGNAVIIDHGGGVTTLYGHNQSLAVSEGQTVAQGQVISYCGSTGNSTGPHCHFEVRVNGEPVSPLSYL